MAEDTKKNTEEVVSENNADLSETKTEKDTAAPAVKARTFSSQDLASYAEIRDDLPQIKTGDIVAVSYRVIEGGKERVQIFEGTVIAQKNSGISKTITVRKTSFGIAVERIFPLNSKLVQSIQVKRHSKVRRSKLYFLRKRKGRAARLKELR